MRAISSFQYRRSRVWSAAKPKRLLEFLFSHRMRIAHSGCAGLCCCQLLISKVDVNVSVGPYILGPVTLVQRDLEDSLSCFRSPRLHPTVINVSPEGLEPFTRYALDALSPRSLKTPNESHTMIPLLPALALAFLSFFSSVFVILRIVIPILPPHP